MTAPDETAAASRGRKPRSPEAQLQRREEIMRSALACFKRKGFHNVSMADIAREDGMSVGNLYNFFENKDAIIEAFAEREILRIRRHLCTDSEHYEEQEACKRDVYELTLARLDPVKARLTLEILAESVENERIRRAVQLFVAAWREVLMPVYLHGGRVTDAVARTRLEADLALLDGIWLRALSVSDEAQKEALAREVSERIWASASRV